MKKGIVKRLSIFGLSLVLTSGLLVGCSTGDTSSASAGASEQQAEHQSEREHAGHDDAESEHENDGHHDEEGHEEGHEHDHERADHFEGKKAETYDEAVSNMKQANARLEKLLSKDELASEDFFKIHRMSYTMENALAKIRKESDGDYKDVAENLESVHLASEKDDAETVREDGEEYLEGAQALLEDE